LRKNISAKKLAELKINLLNKKAVVRKKKKNPEIIQDTRKSTLGTKNGSAKKKKRKSINLL